MFQKENNGVNSLLWLYAKFALTEGILSQQTYHSWSSFTGRCRPVGFPALYTVQPVCVGLSLAPPPIASASSSVKGW